MKHTILLATILFLIACGSSEVKEQPIQVSSQGLIPQSGPELAEELGADPYGMSQYVMAFLYAGDNRDLAEEEQAELMRAHLDNIKRMAEEGDLVIAGPFMDDGELRGIYIFDVRELEEARALTQSDPAIQQGYLRMELKTWYGSAALKVINKIHEEIAEKSV